MGNAPATGQSPDPEPEAVVPPRAPTPEEDEAYVNEKYGDDIQAAMREMDRRAVRVLLKRQRLREMGGTNAPADASAEGGASATATATVTATAGSDDKPAAVAPVLASPADEPEGTRCSEPPPALGPVAAATPAPSWYSTSFSGSWMGGAPTPEATAAAPPPPEAKLAPPPAKLPPPADDGDAKKASSSTNGGKPAASAHGEGWSDDDSDDAPHVVPAAVRGVPAVPPSPPTAAVAEAPLEPPPPPPRDDDTTTCFAARATVVSAKSCRACREVAEEDALSDEARAAAADAARTCPICLEVEPVISCLSVCLCVHRPRAVRRRATAAGARRSGGARRQGGGRGGVCVEAQWRGALLSEGDETSAEIRGRRRGWAVALRERRDSPASPLLTGRVVTAHRRVRLAYGAWRAR
jgi:hypothetical protein